MDPAELDYECGCKPGEVGQAFLAGRIACPTHGNGLRQFVRPPAPWRGTAVLELTLEAETETKARRAVDLVVDEAVSHAAIRGQVVTITERAT